ncbi:MAG: hypothetical protein JST86_19245 [Bacteroidetes bacterium]|nr:hypothetical protein [Bacteroidota bacterium]
MNTSAGLGDSTGSPSGTPFVLPSGIIYFEEIKTITNPLCTTDTMRFFGCGKFVRLAVHLRNNNFTAVTVTFPKGLILTSNDPAFQNGALLQTFATNVPANADWCVNLYLACLNKNRHEPANAATYGNPVITNNSKLIELTELLSSKQLIRITSYGLQFAENIQNAVWDITDSTGLTAKDYSYLNALP